MVFLPQVHLCLSAVAQLDILGKFVKILVFHVCGHLRKQGPTRSVGNEDLKKNFIWGMRWARRKESPHPRELSLTL